jgi:hypothetical protein
MSVSCECCVLFDRGFCDGPIILPEDSYRLCVCVCVCVSVIRCNSNPLHVQSVGSRTKKERIIILYKENPQDNP